MHCFFGQKCHSSKRTRKVNVSPVQVDEEAEQVEAQLNHRLLHVGLELTAIVNLCGVKHPHVAHGHLQKPEPMTSRRHFILLLYNGYTLTVCNSVINKYNLVIIYVTLLRQAFKEGRSRNVNMLVV